VRFLKDCVWYKFTLQQFCKTAIYFKYSGLKNLWKYVLKNIYRANRVSPYCNTLHTASNNTECTFQKTVFDTDLRCNNVLKLTLILSTVNFETCKNMCRKIWRANRVSPYCNMLHTVSNITKCASQNTVSNKNFCWTISNNCFL